MNLPDADEPFSMLLAAYDEALAAGTPTDASSAPPELQGRLHRAFACLERLEHDRRLRAEGPSPPSAAPTNVGRFEVRRELGRGGYGIVFLAYDPLLRRDVALKVPRLEAVFDAEQRRRFLREAQSAAGLEHPNIVPVYEAGEIGTVSYIASAYVSGPTLAAWLHAQRSLVAPHTAAALLAALADGVQHAHRHGILHRDLKPSNVLLQPTTAGPDGLEFVPRLSDFGLAKLLEREEESTRSGALLGTPSYMAPEQAEGRSRLVGPATDVYGLGAILYELLTERPPFKGATVLETLQQVRSDEPIPPRRLRADLPRDLDTICLKCLAKEADQRYASAGKLADDLRRFLAGEPIQARPARWWTVLRHWCRQPRRFADARGWAFWTYAVLVGGWGLSNGLMLTGLLPVGRAEVIGGLWIGAFYFPGLLVSWRISPQHIWALGLGAAYNLAFPHLTIQFAWWWGRTHGSRMWQGDEGWTLYALFTVYFTFLAAAECIGLYAYHVNREKFGAVGPKSHDR